MISLSVQKNLSQNWILCGIIILVLICGCKNEKLIQPGDSVPVAYKKALRLYRNDNYRDAAEAFETVINSARGTDYAQSSYFFEAESYYNSSQYLLAADAYERYLSLYPQSPKREQVAYKDAMSYYQLSPRYKIDQKYSNKAIEKFRIFLSRYPNSQHADEAGRYLTQMRSKLAHKTYGAAKLYMRLDQYQSAIVYLNLTVDQYPETSWAEQALVKEISTYVEYAGKSIKNSKRERYQKAVDTYEKYLQLFPDGSHRQQAEASVDNARSALASMGPGPAPDEEQSVSARQ